MENNNIYILLLNRKDIANEIDQINNLLRRSFPTLDYLKGYLEGFCFGKYKLMTISEFENKHNKNINTSEYCIYILTIDAVN